MATVHLSRALMSYADDVETHVIDADRVIDLRRALVARFPGLADTIETFAVAIDGTIYNDPDYERLRPESEVHFVPKIAGGNSECEDVGM